MTDKFKVGDKVRVLANTNAHEFSIGEVVTIIEDLNRSTTEYNCQGVDETWYCREYELEPENVVDPLDALIVLIDKGELDDVVTNRWFEIAVGQRAQRSAAYHRGKKK